MFRIESLEGRRLLSGQAYSFENGVLTIAGSEFDETFSVSLGRSYVVELRDGEQFAYEPDPAARYLGVGTRIDNPAASFGSLFALYSEGSNLFVSNLDARDVTAVIIHGGGGNDQLNLDLQGWDIPVTLTDQVVELDTDAYTQSLIDSGSHVFSIARYMDQLAMNRRARAEAIVEAASSSQPNPFEASPIEPTAPMDTPVDEGEPAAPAVTAAPSIEESQPALERTDSTLKLASDELEFDEDLLA